MNNVGVVLSLIIVMFNIIVGGWSVVYIFGYFGKEISMIVGSLIGLFVAELSVPVAIVMWLLESVGII